MAFATTSWSVVLPRKVNRRRQKKRWRSSAGTQFTRDVGRELSRGKADPLIFFALSNLAFRIEGRMMPFDE